MNRLKLLLSLSAVAMIGFLVSCSESTENADVFNAQKCLNDLDSVAESNPANLQSCLDKLGGANSPQAYAISCSIRLKQGGLTTTKIIDAFKAQDDGGNGAGGLILTLAFQGAGALNNALVAQEDCIASGSQGLIGVAGMMVTGTAVCSITACVDNPSPGQISAALTTCSSGGCTAAEEAAIATAAVSIADNYCGDDNDSDVCEDFDSAVDANTNGNVVDNAGLVDDLMALLNSP